MIRPLRALLAVLFLAGSVTALADSTDDPAWHQAFHRLAHDLTDRATMLEELR